MAVNILNSSFMELHVRKHLRHPQIRHNQDHMGNNINTESDTNTTNQRQLHAQLRTVSDQLLQKQIEIQNLRTEIRLHKSHNHKLEAGTIVDWGIDDDYEMTGSNGHSNSTTISNDANPYQKRKAYSSSEWAKEDDEITDVELNDDHASIVYSDFTHPQNITLRSLMLEILDTYKTTTSSSNEMIHNILERFKYEIIASNSMKEDELRHVSSPRLTVQRKYPFTYRNSLLIDEFNQLPYKHFVHSFQVVILARGLLYYGIHKTKTKKNKQLLSLICLSLINLYSRTREVILILYLQALQNRLSQFLDNNDSLDYFLNKNTRLLKRYHNDLLSMTRMFPPYRAKQLTGINPKIINSNKLLTSSVFNSMIISLNLKIANILPFVNPEYLEEYFSIYQLDMINDPRGEYRFISLLNQYSTSALPSFDERKILKPLKLRSVSASPSPTIGNHEFDLSNQKKKGFTDFQLADDPSTLANYFKIMRKIFMCIILSILEDGNITNGDKNSKGRFLYNICAKKFKSKLKFPTVLPILDKIYLIIVLFNSLNTTMSSFISELNDFQTYNNYAGDSTENNYDDDYSDVLDESQINENLNLKFANSMDQISNKLAFLESNKNSQIDQLHNLLAINNDLVELFDMYNENVKSLQNRMETEELNIRKSSFDKFRPIVSSPLTAISDSNLNGTNNINTTGNDSNPKKRNSTGLGFNLVKVIESSEEDHDVDQKENLVISTDEGTRSIPSNEKVDGVLSKEELTKTLERLNGLNLGDVNASTPRSSIDFSALENHNDDLSDTVVMDNDVSHGLGLHFVTDQNQIPRSDLSNENFSFLGNNDEFQSELKQKLQAAIK